MDGDISGTLSAAYQGYWGEVTATLDWCEENYVVTIFIAEFWNTLTNLAFILPSLYGAYSVWTNRLELRFALAHLAVVMIGIGSAMFHATMKRTSQLLDEIPMLFGTAVLLFIVIEMTNKGRPNIHLAGGLFIVSLASSVTYVLTKSSAVFFGVYTVMMLAFTSLCFLALRKQPTMPWRLVSVSFWTYLVGFILWNFENNFCPNVRAVRGTLGPGFGVVTQLHGWWHVLAASGGYWCVLFLTQLRMITSRRAYKMTYTWGVLPVIEKDTEALPVELV